METGGDFDRQSVRLCIETLCAAYKNYLDEFRSITGNARRHFAKRNWQELQKDTLKRLELYRKVVDNTEAALRSQCSRNITTPDLWMRAKAVYIQHIVKIQDRELAETFFNSITRRIFHTVGVNPEIEFIDSQFKPTPRDDSPPIYRRYDLDQDLPALVGRIFEDFELGCDFADKSGDARLAAREIKRLLEQLGWPSSGVAVEMIGNPFYRDHGAYLVGRLVKDGSINPLVFAMHNDSKGIFLDAMLVNSDQVRVLFSFSRSYFFVEVDHPHEVVRFLNQLMPVKKRAEIYISLGFNKHGKTELYRHLMDYLTTCSLDRFGIAAGKRGMVMIAFNMPNDDMIFKLIRDRFERPKKTSRQDVMQRYEYVFNHDRAGRLLDVQTFEHLKLETCCFEEELLEELLSQASQCVHRENGQVVFDHIYVERRVTPLDIFLQTAQGEAAKAAVLDFGQAIKDLARVNIFPGDMLIKNFGLSRLGRVVFYDYDELCPLTTCNFRKIPPPRNEMDEMASEPWYFVDEHDVFPEEFKFFIGLPDDLRRIFLSAHGDLFDVAFWRGTQERILAGEVIHISPYSAENRLKNKPSAS